MKSGRTPPRAWKSINSLTDEFSETVSHPAIALTIFIGDRSSVASDHQPYVARHSGHRRLKFLDKRVSLGMRNQFRGA